ncbi:protein DEHYDRATION-INDUCED 19 homolog 3-like [Andrographis paniculata]|uniref:protein DEHYDRATION-INDUCED 19 homolog 3-like n=1 Tax=Andrographis paniculata TaxID=175694 RepID=UPI0021E8753F|nr:protein DEHYDRATION-INDUCED 19 homolog 3-like [Andrographis paniculata]
MDANSWAARLASASRRYHSALRSRSGMKWDEFSAEQMMRFDEIQVDDDMREEYQCPFCSGYFDFVGLSCHIEDEHPAEASEGECPICEIRVGEDMVPHITMQHGNIFKVQCKRKPRKPSSNSTLSLLRGELREGNFQSYLGGSSCIASSRDGSRARVLSSDFFPSVEDYENKSLRPSADPTSIKKSTINGISERKARLAPMSIKDQEEKTKQSNFVQGLLLSMILED